MSSSFIYVYLYTFFEMTLLGVKYDLVSSDVCRKSTIQGLRNYENNSSKIGRKILTEINYCKIITL